jgi:hypothetical protein
MIGLGFARDEQHRGTGDMHSMHNGAIDKFGENASAEMARSLGLMFPRSCIILREEKREREV